MRQRQRERVIPCFDDPAICKCEGCAAARAALFANLPPIPPIPPALRPPRRPSPAVLTPAHVRAMFAASDEARARRS